MKTANRSALYAMRANGSLPPEQFATLYANRIRRSARLLLLAGILGVICTAFLIVEPHLGSTFALPGAFAAGVGSAVATLFARK